MRTTTRTGLANFWRDTARHTTSTLKCSTGYSIPLQAGLAESPTRMTLTDPSAQLQLPNEYSFSVRTRMTTSSPWAELFNDLWTKATKSMSLTKRQVTLLWPMMKLYDSLSSCATTIQNLD